MKALTHLLLTALFAPFILAALLVVELLIWIEPVIGEANGPARLGGEGDEMHGQGGSGADGQAPSPSIFYAVGPSTPREASAADLLCALLEREPEALSTEALGYVVRVTYGRKEAA